MTNKTNRKPAAKTPAKPVTTKLDQVVEQLRKPGGATIADLVAATGWQQHSVRGAIAGSLKKRGHIITSEKIDGVRRYAILKAA